MEGILFINLSLDLEKTKPPCDFQGVLQLKPPSQPSPAASLVYLNLWPPAATGASQLVLLRLLPGAGRGAAGRITEG